MGVGEALDQVVVAEADRAVGLDARRGGRIPRQLGQPVDETEAEPDALAVELQVRAEDAGQHEHRRAFGRVAGRAARACDRRAAPAVGVGAGPRERADRLEVGRRFALQRAGDRGHGALVGEVVEVRDLGAAVEQEARRRALRRRRARRAAVHRAGLHHQVVVGPVEGIGQQRLDPRADRVAFHVAGDHAQVAGDGLGAAVEPGDDGAPGHHRLDAGQLARVGAAQRHLVQKIDELRRDREPGELQPPLQHREVGVEALGGQQRAARRARHAHHALDLQALLLRHRDERLQFGAVHRVGLAVEQRELVGAQRAATAGTRQHLGDQPAARVRDEVQARARRQRAGERERVGDRARGHRRVVERVDAAPVAREQVAHRLRVHRPELAEGADGVDEGAVHEHQQRAAIGCRGHGGELGAAALERLRQRLGAQRVDAFVDRAVELLRGERGDDRDRRVLEQAGDDLEGAQHRLAHPATRRATCCGGLEAGPAELGRDDDLACRRACAQGAAGRVRRLGMQQVARVLRVQHERRAVGDGQHDHVFAGTRGDGHRVATAALRADLHRGFQRAAAAPARDGGAGGPGLAGDDEGDLVGSGRHGSLLCGLILGVKRGS